MKCKQFGHITETELVSDTRSNLGENLVVIRRPIMAEDHSMCGPS
jgi:hypothetical protein